MDSGDSKRVTEGGSIARQEDRKGNRAKVAETGAKVRKQAWSKSEE